MSIDEIAGDGSFFTRADLRGHFISHEEVEKQLDLALKPTLSERIYNLYSSVKNYLLNK